MARIWLFGTGAVRQTAQFLRLCSGQAQKLHMKAFTAENAEVAENSHSFLLFDLLFDKGVAFAPQA